MNYCSSDLSPFMPDQDFVELLWENGQIVMQGQSNRPNKRFFASTSPSQATRFQERVGRDGGIPKNGQFGSTDTTSNELSHFVPSTHIGLNAQDADMVPWINYPIVDNDYCSELFTEFPGASLNSLSAHNVDHGKDSKALAGDSVANRIRTSELFPPSQQWQGSVPTTKSRATEFGVAGSSSSHQVQCGNSPDKGLQKQGAGTCKPPQQCSGVMGSRNFPYFSRPVALFNSSFQSVDESRSNMKASSMVIDSLPVPSKPPREVVSIERSADICHENTTDSNTRSPDDIRHRSSNTAASVDFARHESEKGPQAVVASSSVCSANSDGAEPNDPMQTTKRKDREGEDSGYQSEDLEDESVGVKKHATVRRMSAKRSRAAEVHNLSERKRRDRINEKMRALQELIPNCNKVDKASMLDEAIEYLKTLQLQVQIMSMGSGLCMHPMMFPAGMQHLLPPSMAHFSPMSVNMGMGMGFGYGMGISGSSSCSLIPVRPMHGPQFPYPSMPVPPSLHGMPPGSTGLQMFGIPGQGIPAFGSSSALPARVNMVPKIPGATTGPLSVAGTAPSANSMDQEKQNIN